MTKQGTMPVLRAVGRAILGAVAGMCIGLCPGTLVIAFILDAVLRFGSPTQERVNLYFSISALVGAILGAILGVTIGERQISSGAGQISSGANRKFFHPLGMLVGLVCGAIFGAAFASLFVYSSHPTDAHDAFVVTCVAAVLGSVGGGFVGSTGWMMISGALIGWIIVGIGFVLAYHHIKGMIYGALFGAPIGALLGFFQGLRQEESAKRLKPKAVESSSAASVWDREIDS